MDAAQKLISKTALLFSAAFLIAAPGLAQTLVVSKNSVTLPITGGTNFDFVRVTSSGADFSFTIGAPSASWFSVSPSGTQSTPVDLTVSLIGGPLANTSGTFTLTHGADIQTITVNFVQGGGGTPSGVITASPNDITLTVPVGSGSVVYPNAVALTTSSSTPLTFTTSVTAVAGAPVFAQVNSVTSNQVSSASSVSLTVSANTNTAGLINGTIYTNTLTITPSSGGGVTNITVRLNTGTGGSGGSYTVSPGVISFNYPSGLTSQGITVGSTNAAVNTFTATAASSNNWLLVNGGLGPISLSIGNTLTLSVNTSQAVLLPTGTTTGTVTISNPSNSTDFATITVYLGVNSGTISNLTLSPSSVTFNSAVNGSQLQSQISVSSVNVGTTSFFLSSISPSGSWLSASATSSILPATITVTVNPSGLAAGSYTGSINVTFSGGVNGTQSIPVTLVVGGGGTVSGSVAPTTLNFAYQINSGALVPQQFVTVNGTGTISVAVFTSGNQNWLAASGSGTAPGTVIAYVIPSGLGAGDYTGTITITTTSGTSSVSVNLKVTASPVIYANPATINLNTQQYSTTVGVTASDNSTQSYTASSSASWVTVSSATSSTPGGFNVSINTSGLANGLNTANITITAPNAANTPITVPVVALVSGSTGGGSVTASPTSLTFTAQAGGSTPAAQVLALTSASGSTGLTATVTVATTSGGSWLLAGVASGGTITTPITLSVTANPAGLSAGNYTGTITITPAGGTATTVQVTLTVTGQSVSASTASGTSLSYTYRAGDQTPASQSITVSGNGSFSATAQSSGSWLSVSPGSGTAPATLTATVNPSNLGAGTYNGSVTVAGTGGATGSTTITVTLVVTAPLPTVTRVTNAASFIVGAISPGEIISLFGTAIGPTSSVGLALDQNGRVSTSIGGVQVLVNGFLAPLTFANSTQVNAVVPYEAKGQLSAVVQVRYLGQTSNGVTVPVAATAPALFTANSSGTGPAAVLYPNPALASATRGDVIVLYATGEGETNPAGVTGRVTPGTQPFTFPLLTPIVLIDGQPATILFAGEAPTYTSGLLQLNVQIPQTARSGDLPVILRIGGVDSQPNVTISVR